MTWLAARGRDLPLLCGLALIITFVVALVASVGEWIEAADFRFAENPAESV